ncbi:hypothetical protein CDAR_29741 [Caerostris darwini]|uniref:Uncharacterized protein n=1 Tax=Caerostris darwini TaxID=1538125 RepID=A0AAV4QSI7_9ARAC|nr:hypothetical protein CDAR_29741 [Caerostris darwini]
MYMFRFVKTNNSRYFNSKDEEEKNHSGPHYQHISMPRGGWLESLNGRPTGLARDTMTLNIYLTFRSLQFPAVFSSAAGEGSRSRACQPCAKSHAKTTPCTQ